MNKCSNVLALVLSAGLAAGVNAQLVSPVPPAPAPTPEYTPPPPPPPPEEVFVKPAPAPEPDLPAPDLVVRDKAGKFVMLEIPLEEAAINAILAQSASDEAKTKAQQAIEDRRARMEQAVAKNALTAVQIRGKMADLDKMSGVKEIGAIQGQSRALIVSPALIDSLQTGGGLTPKELGRARTAAANYKKAFNEDVKAQVDGDAMKMIEPLARGNARMSWVEPARALEEMLAKLSTRWTEVRGTLGLTDEQTKAIADAEKAFATASGTGKVDALAKILAGLTASQASTAMSVVARPLPAGAPPAETAAPAPVKPVKPAGKPKEEKKGEK